MASRVATKMSPLFILLLTTGRGEVKHRRHWDLPGPIVIQLAEAAITGGLGGLPVPASAEFY